MVEALVLAMSIAGAGAVAGVEREPDVAPDAIVEPYSVPAAVFRIPDYDPEEWDWAFGGDGHKA